jgi:hypothetical protein
MLSRRLSVDTIRAISAASPVAESTTRTATTPAVAATAFRPLVFARPAIAAGAGNNATARGSVVNARAADFTVGGAHNDPGPAMPDHFNLRFGDHSEVSLVQLAAATASSGEEKPVAADGFSIDVDMCMVKLSRPWLSDALLTLPGWYIAGVARGSFSAGTGAGDSGTLPLLPTACIFIRNLNLHAQWSDADRQVIESSGGLGSFSLIGRKFDTNSATLTVPGMQSIAWMYQTLPVLPPSDPPPQG